MSSLLPTLAERCWRKGWRRSFRVADRRRGSGARRSLGARTAGRRLLDRRPARRHQQLRRGQAAVRHPAGDGLERRGAHRLALRSAQRPLLRRPPRQGRLHQRRKGLRAVKRRRAADRCDLAWCSSSRLAAKRFVSTSRRTTRWSTSRAAPPSSTRGSCWGLTTCRSSSARSPGTMRRACCSSMRPAARPRGPTARPYRVDEGSRPGLIGAASPALWDEMAERLAALPV